jgi:hypothetical protein
MTSLDDAVLARDRVKCILNITLADDAEMTDDVHCGCAEHVIVLVRERLRWSYDDRVAGMDAERVEVL